MNTTLQNTFRTPAPKPVAYRPNTFKKRNNALVYYEGPMSDADYRSMLHHHVQVGMIWFLSALAFAGFVSWLVV